jgi:hypothetical protein
MNRYYNIINHLQANLRKWLIFGGAFDMTDAIVYRSVAPEFTPGF